MATILEATVLSISRCPPFLPRRTRVCLFFDLRRACFCSISQTPDPDRLPLRRRRGPPSQVRTSRLALKQGGVRTPHFGEEGKSNQIKSNEMKACNRFKTVIVNITLGLATMSPHLNIVLRYGRNCPQRILGWSAHRVLCRLWGFMFSLVGFHVFPLCSPLHFKRQGRHVFATAL